MTPEQQGLLEKAARSLQAARVLNSDETERVSFIARKSVGVN